MHARRTCSFQASASRRSKDETPEVGQCRRKSGCSKTDGSKFQVFNRFAMLIFDDCTTASSTTTNYAFLCVSGSLDQAGIIEQRVEDRHPEIDRATSGYLLRPVFNLHLSLHIPQPAVSRKDSFRAHPRACFYSRAESPQSQRNPIHWSGRQESGGC